MSRDACLHMLGGARRSFAIVSIGLPDQGLPGR
jgi:hypothetical protein